MIYGHVAAHIMNTDPLWGLDLTINESLLLEDEEKKDGDSGGGSSKL